MNWYTIIGLVFIFFGTYMTYYGSNKSDEKTQKELSNKIDERNLEIKELSKTNEALTEHNKELIGQSTDLLSKSQGIQGGNTELLRQNTQLLKKIGNYQEEIEIKNKIIEDLVKKSKAVGRGNSSAIKFNGDYLDKSGSGISVVSGTSENIALKKMVAIYNEKNWQDLLKISDEQIQNSPTWMTPYFFKAICLFHLGNQNEAKKLLLFVEEETPGDLDYLKNLAMVYNDIIGDKEKAKQLIESIPKEQRHSLNPPRGKK